jgi:hypothetical protein
LEGKKLICIISPEKHRSETKNETEELQEK